MPGSKLTKGILFITGSALIISLTCIAVWIIILLSRTTIYEGICVEGIDISGLTRKKALSLLESSLKEQYGSRGILLNYNGETWTLSLDDISLTYLVEKAVDTAYSLGRSGSLLERMREIFRLRSESRNIDCTLSFNRRMLRDFLWKIKEKIDREPQNATISYSNGKITRTGDTVGRSLNIDSNMDIIEDAILKKNYDDIQLIVEEKKPRITTDDVNQIEKVLASYSTYFNPQEVNRTYNMKLSSQKINNYILKPGEVFSMNEVLGPRTAENGYKDAPIIIKNKVEQGIGGGVCQVVSTLYNAVLLSRLEVVERTNHSLAIGYVKPGLDATIAEDYLDFKFRNSMDYCISIHAEVTGNRLKIDILGKDMKDGLKVKLVSTILEEIPPEGEEYVIDENVLDGIKVILREAKNGFRVVVHREVYDAAGRLVKKEKISEDVYKPIKAQYRVNSNYQKQLNQ